jgi:hypothetical protein
MVHMFYALALVVVVEAVDVVQLHLLEMGVVVVAVVAVFIDLYRLDN